MRTVTRREFMRAGAILTGCAAGLLAPGGGGLPAGRAIAGGVDFVESSCGPREKTGKRVLVAYASRSGTTGGVAEAIGRTLCDEGFEVDTRLAKHVEDVSPYCAVVLGSAIQRASWLPDAMKFAGRNREVLSRVPVAYFLTCMTLHQETAETRKTARSFMEPVLGAVPEVRPVDSGLFAGVLDYSRLGALMRMLVKSRMEAKGIPEGDFRNWKAITSWAKGLAAPFGKTGVS